jgi:enoyl-CoA hydratase/carnithine racemase
MVEKSILYNLKDHIAWVTLNRPDSGNALDLQGKEDFTDIIAQVSRNDGVHVVVISGSGRQSFCSGGEVKLPIMADEISQTGFACRTASAVASIVCPVIACINGDALGEGLEIALSCDIRISSNKSRFGLPQIIRGLIPVDGGTQRLPRIIGKAKALELILTGEILEAQAALDIGLVNKLVEPERLDQEVLELAQNLAGKAPIAVRYIKEAVNKGLDLTLEQGLLLEGDLYFILHTTEDRTEGIQAFLQKRRPQFKGK